MSEKIALSPDVMRELKARKVTADELLREALHIKLEGFTAGEKHFPEGTVFIAWYKNRALSAIATKGYLKVEGKLYSSLSSAAAHYTGRPTTNGWDFWAVKKPGKAEYIPAHAA